MRTDAIVASSRSGWWLFWNGFRKDRTAVIGGLIVLGVVSAALLAPWIAPHDPYTGIGAMRLAPPGTEGHWLGVDGQGRDILSRLLYGGRITLVVAIVPILAAAAVSLFIGMVAAYFPGKFSELIMRILDVLFAFPMVLLAIAISTIVGVGMGTIMVAVFIMNIPYMSRIVYNTTVTEKTREYVEAAQALGSTGLEILVHELLPNVVSNLIVYATTLIGIVIVFASGLSFLGIGIQSPDADWGKMTADGMQVLTQGAPHVATIPGLVILVVATAFNWLGDGLRDALDPYKRT